MREVKTLEEKFCGVWGHLREEYLQTKKPELYNLLVEEGELEEYLTGYQSAYSNRAEKTGDRARRQR